MERQAAAVGTLKAEVPGLAQMRRLAMRRFARTLRDDPDAVRNAVAEP